VVACWVKAVFFSFSRGLYQLRARRYAPVREKSLASSSFPTSPFSGAARVRRPSKVISFVETPLFFARVEA